jgi:hypothetical protein
MHLDMVLSALWPLHKLTCDMCHNLFKSKIFSSYVYIMYNSVMYWTLQFSYARKEAVPFLELIM